MPFEPGGWRFPEAIWEGLGGVDPPRFPISHRGSGSASIQVRNVTDYDAAGTGDVDDTQAVADAIDDADPSAPCVVFFPCGRYRVRGIGIGWFQLEGHIEYPPAPVRRCLFLVGEGPDSILMRAFGEDEAPASNARDPILRIGHTEDVLIANLGFDIRGAPDTGVYFEGVRRVRIERTTWRDTLATLPGPPALDPRGFPLLLDPATPNRTAFAFREGGTVGAFGILDTRARTNEDLRIVDNRIEDAGIEFHRASRVLVSGNTFRRASLDAVAFHVFETSVSEPMSDLVVADNVIEDPVRHGIRITADPSRSDAALHNVSVLRNCVTKSAPATLQGDCIRVGVRTRIGSGSMRVEDLVIQANRVEFSSVPRPGSSGIRCVIAGGALLGIRDAREALRTGAPDADRNAFRERAEEFYATEAFGAPDWPHFARARIAENSVRRTGSFLGPDRASVDDPLDPTIDFAIYAESFVDSVVTDNSVSDARLGICVTEGLLRCAVLGNKVRASNVAYRFDGSRGGCRVFDNCITLPPAERWYTGDLQDSDVVEMGLPARPGRLAAADEGGLEGVLATMLDPWDIRDDDLIGDLRARLGF